MPEQAMPEQAVPEQALHERKGRRGWLVPALLVAAIVAIFALCLLLAPRTGAPAEAFGGTDSAVTQVLEERGVKPWFQPLFQPGSSEVESGLFALQAALGAGVFGYVLGNLRGRRAGRQDRDDAAHLD